MKRIILAVLLPLLFGFLLSSPSFAQNTAAGERLNEMIEETQKQSTKEDVMAVIWWIPTEFWRLAFESSGELSSAEVDEFLEGLEGYTIFGVIYADTKDLATLEYRSESSIRNSLRVIDAVGAEYKPMAEDETSSTMQLMLAMVKPMLSNMLGELGENFNFYVFDNTNAAGKRFDDPLQKGNISAKLFGETFSYRRPLGSLVPKKSCPVDGEKMNGSWEFCPWHGKALE